jgi:hypothetical protein
MEKVYNETPHNLYYSAGKQGDQTTDYQTVGYLHDLRGELENIKLELHSERLKLDKTASSWDGMINKKFRKEQSADFPFIYGES